MKEGWKEMLMVDVCDLITCGIAARPNYVDEGIPFLSAKNVKDGTVLYDTYNCITEQNHIELTKNNKPSKGDVLYTRVGSFGEAAVIEEDIEFSIFVSLTLIKPKEFLDSYYLKYYLNSHKIKSLAKKSITSSGVGNLNVGTVRKFPIPIPPLQEQQHIVSILDEAFAAIDNAKANIEKNIANAKELFQAKLNAIFSRKGDGSANGADKWEEKSLGEIGKVSMCKRILKDQTTSEGDIPFYKIGTFGREPDAYISRTIYEEYKSKYSFPKKGDVLISASGTIGRRVVYDGEPAFFQDSNIVWIDNNEELVLNEYLYQFYGVCDWNPSKGATINRLYNDDLRRIKISYPNLDEQRKLIKLMEELSAQTKAIEDAYAKKAHSLDELKKSILQKAFSGELSLEQLPGKDGVKAIQQ